MASGAIDLYSSVGMPGWLEHLSQLLASAQIRRQPLGFYRVYLTTQNAMQEGIYLHAWLDQNQFRQGAEPEVHSHIFDMNSTVLIGSLRNEIFTAKPALNGTHYFVKVHYNDGSPLREVENRMCRIELSHQENVSSGNEYTQKSGLFHRTIVTEYPLVTLMRKVKVNKEPFSMNIIRKDYKHAEVSKFNTDVRRPAQVKTKIIETLERFYGN